MRKAFTGILLIIFVLKTTYAYGEVHPYVAIEETYNDNIFLTTDEKRDDFITTITPGIKRTSKAGRSGQEIGLDVDGGVEVLEYARNKGLNNLNPYLSASVGNRFFDIHYAGRQSQETLTEVSATAEQRLLDYWINEGGIDLNLEFDRVEIKGSYAHKNKFYEKEEDRDRNNDTDTFFATGYLRVSPRTRYSVGYSHEIVDYPKREGSNRIYDRIWAGIDEDLFAKIKVRAKVGYTIEGGDSEGDSDSFVFDFSVQYDPTKYFSCGASVSRSIETSDDVDEGTRERTRYGVNCKYTAPFNKRFTIAAGGYYDDTDYTSDRKDEGYGLKVEPQYEINEWLTMGGGYQFKERISSSENAGYKNNIFYANITMEF